MPEGAAKIEQPGGRRCRPGKPESLVQGVENTRVIYYAWACRNPGLAAPVALGLLMAVLIAFALWRRPERQEAVDAGEPAEAEGRRR